MKILDVDEDSSPFFEHVFAPTKLYKTINNCNVVDINEDIERFN